MKACFDDFLLMQINAHLFKEKAVGRNMLI